MRNWTGSGKIRTKHKLRKMISRKIKKSCFHIDKEFYLNQLNLSSLHLFNSRKRKISPSVSFSAVMKFLNYPESCNDVNEYADVDCFALRLCKYLLEKIKTYNVVQESSGSFPENFYHCSLNDAKNIGTLIEVDDSELMLIHMKQMVHLMRTAELISWEKDSTVKRDAKISDIPLFMRLFHSFWFYTNWEEIFPSDPDAAAELHENRSFIRDLVLGCEKKTEVSAFSNNFFELTGFAEKNDLFRVSFLDFYLLTWLKHFGIMKYHCGTRYSPVSIQLTDMGKKLFSNLG